MAEGSFIEIDDYIDGRWVTRRYSRVGAENLFHQLAQALGVRAISRPDEPSADRLRVLVE